MQRRLRNEHPLAATMILALCFGLLAASCASRPIVGTKGVASLNEAGTAGSAVEAQPVMASPPRRANFGGEDKSPGARRVADWVLDLGDNRGLPFAIVDKTDAKVFVFCADGELLGAAPALLGLARGDDTAAGIGERQLSEIPPKDRTTPAGRFLASLGHNYHGKDILWVDYDNAISLHRVVTNNPKERRLQRLATPTPLDNRISFGCINVPEQFYNDIVRPTFTGTYGVVYVLPETRPHGEVFTSYYDVE
jgi:hypothetical protein